MVDLLEAWRASGSSRLDRDLDGKQDAGPGPVIMDVLYPRLLDAVLAPALGPDLDALKALVGRTNAPSSGFTGGGIAYLDKDLRTLLGTRFRDPYCDEVLRRGGPRGLPGRGVERRRGGRSADRLGAGHARPGGVDLGRDAERIRFQPGLLPTTIRYTNRPSGIQQVMSFGGHRPR